MHRPLARSAYTLATLLLGLSTTSCGVGLTVGGALGIDALQDDDDDANNPPGVSVSTPSGAVNDVIALDYVLTDAEGNRASIVVEYDAGGGFQPASQAFDEGSEGTTNLEASSTGTAHTFLWNSSQDLGLTNVSGITVRITATDASTGVSGAPGTTSTSFSALNFNITTIAQRPQTLGIIALGIDTRDDGDIVLADALGHRLVQIADDASQTTSVLAGTGVGGYNGDGILGTDAQLNNPASVVALADPSPGVDGDLLVGDAFNARIRRYSGSSGFMTSVAGGGSDPSEGASLTAPGVIANAAFVVPRDIAADASGNVFYVEDERARVVNLQGVAPLLIDRGSMFGAMCTAQFPSDPMSLSAGLVWSVLSNEAECDTSNSSLIFPELEEPSAVAYAGGPLAGESTLFTLELGPLGGFRVTPTYTGNGSANDYPRILASNYHPTATVTLESPLGAGLMIPPGDTRVVADGSQLAEMGSLADMALWGGTTDVLVFTTFRDDRVYCLNLNALPQTVAGVTVNPGTVVPIAGTGNNGLSGDGGDPLQADLTGPLCIGSDAAGNIFMGEPSNRVRVIAGASGYTLGSQTVAANTIESIPAVLPGITPELVTPLALSVLPDGDLAVTDVLPSDPRSNRVFRVSAADGVETPLAGSGVFGDTGDGSSATAAGLGTPIWTVTDPTGALLLVSDLAHHRVRAVNLSGAPQTLFGVTIQPGAIATVVGTGVGTGTMGALLGDGAPTTSATLLAPGSLSFGPSGLLWIGDTGNYRIRAANPTSVAITVAGVTVAPGTIQTVIGDGTAGTAATDGDGAAASGARVDSGNPFAHAGGVLYFLDGTRSNTPEPRVRALNLGTAAAQVAGVSIAPGNVDTVAFSGAPRLSDNSNLGDGGSALTATLRLIGGVSLRADGLLFVTDNADHRVRVVNTTSAPIALGGTTIASGNVETVLGTGIPGFAGEEIQVASGFFGSTGGGPINGPAGIAALPDGRVLVVETLNGSVRLVNLGGGAQSYGGVTAAAGRSVIVAGSRSGLVRAQDPQEIAVEDTPNGRIIFSDLGAVGDAPAIKQIDPQTRIVTLLAGDQTETVYSMGNPVNLGDGDQAVLATLRRPEGLDLDAQRSLYIADAGNNRIRYVNRTTAATNPVAGLTVQPGHIQTVVNGSQGSGLLGDDDGARLDGGDNLLDLFFPSDVDRATNVIWVVDSGRVLRCDTQAGPNPIVDGVFDPGGSGPAAAESVAAIDDDVALVAVRGPGFSTIVSIDYSGGGPFAVTLIAGTGAGGWNGDHLNRLAMNFGAPIDSLHLDGNVLFVADTENSRVVAINLGTTLVTIAGLDLLANEARTIAGGGTGGGGFNGDALPPNIALLNFPTGVATTSGSVLVVDNGNGRIRRFQR